MKPQMSADELTPRRAVAGWISETWDDGVSFESLNSALFCSTEDGLRRINPLILNAVRVCVVPCQEGEAVVVLQREDLEALRHARLSVFDFPRGGIARVEKALNAASASHPGEQR